MIYQYTCQCGHTEEVICSIAEHKSSIKCPKCKKNAPQVITGGVHRCVTGRTIGHQLDANTDKMSLDAKIFHGTQKYQNLNSNLKPEVAEQDRRNKIEKEIKSITAAHNS